MNDVNVYVRVGMKSKFTLILFMNRLHNTRFIDLLTLKIEQRKKNRVLYILILACNLIGTAKHVFRSGLFSAKEFFV